MKKAFQAGLGATAICLVQFCYLPQTVKILKTGIVAGLSVETFSILTAGLGLFLLHSVWTRNILYTVSNAIGFVNAGTVLVLILAKG